MIKKIIIYIALFSIHISAQTPQVIGPPGGRVRKISVHPSNPSIVYAAEYNGGIFRTDDGGETTNPIETYFGDFRPDVIALPPRKEDYVYMSFGGYYLLSKDKGETWEVMHGTGKSTVSNISFNPLNSTIMFIVQNYKEIWKSTDSGDNWELFKEFSIQSNLVEVNPVDTTILYSSADRTLFKSTDSGNSWFKVLGDSNTFAPLKIVYNLYNKNSLFFLVLHGPSPGIYKTIDGGYTVTKYLDVFVDTFVLNPQDTLTLYASHGDPVFTPNGGIIKTTDGGENWYSVANGIPGSYVTANTLAINLQNPQELYAGIGNLGVFKTTNGGDNWFLSRLSNAQVYNIFIDESFSEGTLISSQYGWGLMKTTDNGETWQHPEFDTEYQHLVIWSMSFNTDNKNIGFLAAKHGLYKTADGGNSWSLATNHLDRIYEVAYHPHNSNIVFAGGTDNSYGPPTFGYLYKSNDGGENWQTILETEFNSVGDFVFHPTNPNIIYARYSFGIRKSADMGNTWVEKNEGLLSEDGYIHVVSSLKINKSNHNILFCTQESILGGLFMSTNGGDSWIQIDSALFPLSKYVVPSSILLDNSNSERLYVGLLDGGQPQTETFHNGGLYLTEDTGKSWEKIYDGQVNVVKADNSTPRNIYFGTKFGIITIVDTFHVTDLEENTETIPTEYSLSQNYPNPFNPTTTISYQIQKEGSVTLKIYNILGKEIRTLINGEKRKGKHNITFDASTLTSGIYFYTLRVNDYIATKKMLLTK